MTPTLSLVFVSYNSTNELAVALSSLQEAEPELVIEKIVVDNASEDLARLRTVCQCHGAKLLEMKKNLGYGAAANRGFRIAQGEYLAVANPDLIFPRLSLTRLVNFFEEYPDAAAVAPQLLYMDGTPHPTARRFPRLRYILAGRRSFIARFFPRMSRAEEFQYAQIANAQEPVSVDAIIGALMLFRRTALRQVGGFDEGYFLFAEDIDICRRLKEKGWQVFVDPRVRVHHYYGGVRRHHADFSDYHRLKGLCRFFCKDRNGLGCLVINFLFAGYLFLSEASWLVGLREAEYSWNRSKSTVG
ncbi:MAG: glycosyltransferase family 2 protein [candidate division WOR-3 bacterium]